MSKNSTVTTLNKFIHKWIWLMLIIFCTIGLVFPIIGLIAIICMMGPIIVSFFRGRLWCGNYCPRGSFNDFVLSKLSRNTNIPKLFKSNLFRILFLIGLMSFFIIQFIYAWGNIYNLGYVFIKMVIITTTLAIVFGVSFNQRSWCAFCPMGTLAYFISKTNLAKRNNKHITFDKEKCINCNQCTKNCTIDIDVLSHKNQGKVLDSDCMKCQNCIKNCPKRALYIA